MSAANQGRNEIRLNNSGGKCLLENWVEERAVSDLDAETIEKAKEKECTKECDKAASDQRSTHSSAQQFREGHKGILTTDLDSDAAKKTTCKQSYKAPEGPNVRTRGLKSELLEKMLYEQVSKEVYDEFNKPAEVGEYKSVTHNDFNIDEFVSVKPAPKGVHDYKIDQPVTFWTEHKDKITGVSQVKTRDTAFRKNDAFSKPIDEYWDEPKPFIEEGFPNM